MYTVQPGVAVGRSSSVAALPLAPAAERLYRWADMSRNDLLTDIRRLAAGNRGRIGLRASSSTADAPAADSRRRKVALMWATFVAIGVMGTSACNDCDFSGTRCAGGAVEQCGGVDQQIGRTIKRTPCVGLNPVCVSGGSEAYCAASESRTCTPGETRCDSDVLFRCGSLGFDMAIDCTSVTTLREGGGLDPAGFTCNENAGSKPGCRAP